ncbi:TetR/AcrR family transcriptional regulator [Mycolicibacterium sp.]|uniref:TetR/AcrR family transcriptional regulator n=1 Tax=Mycolicibacterium sp. TaxID=2320850 RepID=UPI0025E81F9D|nr:TetR/AcrR family transcriptional regulator [Mycolicibacterium sp.]
MTARKGPRVRRGSAPGLLRDAAREIFAERGYRATTREIAERAGVSHELIFRYFETKEKLLFDAVVTPLLDAVEGLQRNWIADNSLRELSSEDLAYRFTEELYGFLSSNQSISRAMVHLFTEGSTEGEVEHLRVRIADTLASMLTPVEQYLSSEDMRNSSPALQLRMMMLLIGVTANFLTGTYRDDDEVPDRAEIITELAHFVYNGLRKA